MPAKTMTRPSAQHAVLPALLASALHLQHQPFNSLHITPQINGRAGRNQKAIPPGYGAGAFAHDLRMAMVGHAFFIGSMQLMAACMHEFGLVSTPGTGRNAKARAPWGSKTGRRGRKAKARAKA